MMKRLLQFALLAVALALVYIAAAIFFAWKWMTPHHEVPREIAGTSRSHTYAAEYQDLVREFEGMLAERRRTLEAPSISAAVGVDGRTIWAGAVGFADIEEKKAADIDGQYRIGSTSKPLTATAMMKLVEEGFLDLDQDIRAYLPDYPTPAEPITARRLASHMAGIRHYRLFDPFRWPPSGLFSTRRYTSVSGSLESFKDDALLFTPGSDFAYSTYGYVLLSAVMEGAASESFREIVQSRVLDRLGMDSTVLEDADRPSRNIVAFYNSGNGKYGRAYPVDNSGRWAGGGFLSTPSDLVKLGQALLTDGYLTAESRAEMFEPQRLPTGEINPESYALGWRCREKELSLSTGSTENVLVIHHGGRSVGGASFLLLIPEYDIAISVLSNSSSGDIRSGIQELAYQMTERIIQSTHREER